MTTELDEIPAPPIGSDGGAVAPGANVPVKPLSLLDLLLEEQQELTAVERFSLRHDDPNVPAQARYYSALIPAMAPKPGQQYAFDVDLDRCSGCKACVAACHTLNGLDERETWRDVGLLVGGSTASPVMQHVTMACHHCLEPGCLSACPVDAYEKDLVTGIVKHLDDQCFGCQYCTLACPYDVPKYHKAKGIVRKCDMCSDRLANGEAPACVQACPHEAIAIRIVDRQQVVDDSEANVFLPAAPDPQITLPTTTYRTKRVFPRNLLPADYHGTSAQKPHWPLIVMLVLTQLSVGAFCAGLLLERWLSAELMAAVRPLHSLNALIFGLTALAASTLHLGRPQFAYRAVIGLRHSWLSREIVAFGLFAGLAVAFSAGNWFLPDFFQTHRTVHRILGWAVSLVGMAGICCSIMIYAVTRRALWSFPLTAVRFLLSTALLGMAAFWLSLLFLAVTDGATSLDVIRLTGRRLCQGLVAVGSLKLLFEASLFRHLASRQMSPLKRSALLIAGPFASVALARFMSGALGAVVMPIFLLNVSHDLSSSRFLVWSLATVILVVACVAGELLERFLFFGAVAAPRMPGQIRT